MILDDCFLIVNALSDDKIGQCSYATKYKASLIKDALKPMVDYANKELQPIREKVMKSIPVEIKDPNVRSNIFMNRWNSVEISEEISPILSLEVEVTLPKFDKDEFIKSSLSSDEITLLRKFDLILEEADIPAPAVLKKKEAIAVVE